MTKGRKSDQRSGTGDKGRTALILDSGRGPLFAGANGGVQMTRRLRPVGSLCNRDLTHARRRKGGEAFQYDGGDTSEVYPTLLRSLGPSAGMGGLQGVGRLQRAWARVKGAMHAAGPSEMYRQNTGQLLQYVPAPPPPSWLWRPLSWIHIMENHTSSELEDACI